MPSKLILIDWIDAHTQDGWEDINEFTHDKHTVTVRTVGWAIRDDATGVWLTHGFSVDSDGKTHGLNCTFIPRGMILKTQELKYT